MSAIRDMCSAVVVVIVRLVLVGGTPAAVPGYRANELPHFCQVHCEYCAVVGANLIRIWPLALAL